MPGRFRAKNERVYTTTCRCGIKKMETYFVTRFLTEIAHCAFCWLRGPKLCTRTYLYKVKKLWGNTNAPIVFSAFRKSKLSSCDPNMCEHRNCMSTSLLQNRIDNRRWPPHRVRLCALRWPKLSPHRSPTKHTIRKQNMLHKPKTTGAHSTWNSSLLLYAPTGG